MQGSGLGHQGRPGSWLLHWQCVQRSLSCRPAVFHHRTAPGRRAPVRHAAQPALRENWGAISPSHAAFVARLTTLIRPGGDVLDTACGTGKYWPALLAAGLRVTGVDQSAGMLAQARRKHPEVPARVLALQDLAGAGDLRGRFDGLLCVDALENIAPEDWPGAAAGLAAALRPRTRRTSPWKYMTARCLRPMTRARCPARISREAARRLPLIIRPGTRHVAG